ncbi:MAG: hypothetical protein AAF599_03385 [Bacteroidota bacterium]
MTTTNQLPIGKHVDRSRAKGGKTSFEKAEQAAGCLKKRMSPKNGDLRAKSGIMMSKNRKKYVYVVLGI